MFLNNEENVRVINYESNSINDITINNNKILIRLNNLNYKCKRINFKYNTYKREEEFLIEEIIDQVNFKLDSYSYIFLMNVEEEEPEKNKEKKI